MLNRKTQDSGVHVPAGGRVAVAGPDDSLGKAWPVSHSEPSCAAPGCDPRSKRTNGRVHLNNVPLLSFAIELWLAQTHYIAAPYVRRIVRLRLDKLHYAGASTARRRQRRYQNLG